MFAVEHDCFSIDEWHGKGAAKLLLHGPFALAPEGAAGPQARQQACSGG
jgi:hypothetical protein